MDTKTLCLGALHLCDASGYEIKKLFESAFSHFQKASFGSIYPALDKLEQQGLVTSQVELQEKRPAKKIYALTESGHQVFLSTLAVTPPTESCRSDFIALIFFAELLKTEQLSGLIEQHIADLHQSIGMLQSISQEDTLGPGAAFSVKLGIATKTARLEYLQANKAAFLTQHSTGENQGVTT